jgi:hypothetical protein
MATNQTTLTLAVDTTYQLPVDYSAITLVGAVNHQSQLLVFRNSIDDLSSAELSLRDYRGLGVIPSSWLTLDTHARSITAITIPPGATYTLESGETVGYPVMVSGESLEVRRTNVSAEPYVTWFSGTKVTPEQLNLQTSQLLGLIQELQARLANIAEITDPLGLTNPLQTNFNANGYRITDLADAVDGGDAVSKDFLTALVEELVSNKLGVPNGIATLDSSGLLDITQRPTSAGSLPSSFFSQATTPVRSTGGVGLFDYGSLWYSTTNGRLYVYVFDDRYTGTTLATDGEIGYWVDVSAPVV